MPMDQHGSAPPALSAENFRELLEAAPYAVVIVNCEGQIAIVNGQAEALFGYGREELLGRPVETLLPERYQEKHVVNRNCYLASPFLRPMGAGLELLGRRKGGAEFPVEISLSPLKTESGLFVTAIVVDRSERKRAEQERLQLEIQVQQAQKLESLGILTGGIAHDFNNLLTAILGNASLALMQIPPESPAHQPLLEIEKGALRSADLVRQMLAYAGKGRFYVEPLNLSKVIEEIAHLLQTVISKKAVLRFEFAPELPTVEADATQIRQIVMNMITNASDAIGDKSGVIALRTGVMYADRKYLTTTHIPVDLPEGYYVYLEVADSGCGMDKETLKRVFDPFFTTKFTGRGLGLAAVLGIVRGHRGAVKIYSEPKRGTTFKVLFPCSELPVRQTAAAADAQSSWRGSGAILVVDDEDSVRATAKSILELQGFEVMLAADGREALTMFRQDPDKAQAVLLDLTMPHMSGEELFRELRLLRPGIRVIIMSGYNEQEVTNLFLGKGLAGFLQKPFRAEDLLAAIRRLLPGSRPQ